MIGPVFRTLSIGPALAVGRPTPDSAHYTQRVAICRVTWAKGKAVRVAQSQGDLQARPACPILSFCAMLEGSTTDETGASMSETLVGLARLQRVELELHGLRNAVESRRRALRAIERRIQKQDEQIAEKGAQIRALQLASDAAELEIKTRESEIDRLRDALNKAKTNKEYAAILTQINTDKADNAKYEEAALQQLSQVEAARKELEALKESRDRDRDRLRREAENVESFATSRAGDIQRLQSEREQVADSLPPGVVQAFDRVAERHDGEAMAAVEQPDRRRQEFVCGGCHMSIPLDIFNAAQFGDDLKYCGSCGRILYVPQTTGSGSR